MLDLGVYIDAIPMWSIAPWGDVRFSTHLTGDWELSWQVMRKRTDTMMPNHPAVVTGKQVALKAGPETIWAGTLAEPDWSTNQLVALGCPRQAENTQSISTFPALSTKPNTVIDGAITRGAIDWTRVSNFGTASLGSDDAAESFTSLAALLDAYTDETGHQWHVDARRRLIHFDAPAQEPRWLVHVDDQQLGYANERSADRVMVRYRNSSTGNLDAEWYPTTAPPAPAIEKPLSVVARGQISSAAASLIAEKVWRRSNGIPGFTGELTLFRGDVTTIDGKTAPLEYVRGGDVMRLMGQPGRNGEGLVTDIVIEQTDLTVADGRLTVRPVGTAPRSFEDAVATIWKGETI